MRTGMSFRQSASLLAMCALVALMPVLAGASGDLSGADYVLLVDCTGTMKYAGRGEATIEAVQQFVNSLNVGDRVSVFGYGEDPFPAMPVYPATVTSEDSKASIFKRITLPFTADRTDITRGLDRVWQERENVFSRALHGEAKAKEGSAYVVLLTDGKLIPVYSDYSHYDEIYTESKHRLEELGELFADMGIPIYSVGLGSPEKVDGELLTDVSGKTGGEYVSVPSSDNLPNAWDRLLDSVVGKFQSMTNGDASVGGEEDLMVADPASGSDGEITGSVIGGIMEMASASEPRTGRAEAALAKSFGSTGRTIYQSVVGVLGVVMGFVAIGIHRRQAWTGAFTKPLLHKEVRVKGYLRRVLPDGVIAAHRNIPIENPGLPVIEIGVGTDYAAELRETLLEFAGTTDGSPPILRVLKGSARVAGEPVEDARALLDGDIIECEGKAYKYLRGQRA